MSLELFQSHVNDIMKYSVDSAQRQRAYSNIKGADAGGSRRRISRDEFWNTMYEKRYMEDEVFGSFIEGDVDILCVSGQLGCGKSTYIRYQFEHRHICEGIIINMKKYRSIFDKKREPRDSMRDSFHDILTQEFRDNLLLNTKLAIINNLSRERDLSHTSIALQQLTIEQSEEDPAIDGEAEDYLAAQALQSLPKRPALVTIRDELRLHAREKMLLRSQIEKALGDDPLLAPRVLGVLEWQDWLRLYCKMYKSDSSKLLVLDNLDELDLKQIQTDFFHFLLDVIDQVNLHSDLAQRFVKNLPPLKIVFAIRDENISRIRPSAGATLRTMHVTLGEGNRRLEVPDKNSFQLRTNRDFGCGVIRKRLEMLTVLSADDPDRKRYELFRQLIERHWLFMESDKSLDVFELNNYSVRLILSMVSQTVLELVERCMPYGSEDSSRTNRLDQGILLSEFGKLPMKAMLIRSLTSIPSTQVLLEKLKIAHQREHSESFCCPIRMILSFLNSGKYGGGIEFHVLLDRMRAVMGFSETDIRDSLYVLFKPSNFEGDLVTIYQYKTIRTSADIQNSALIRSTPRGREILKHVMINIDYFGNFFFEDDPHILMEYLPAEAVRYVSTIYSSTVKELKNRHIVFWNESIMPKFGLAPDSAFRAYCNEFTFRHTFYMDRVAASHMESVKTYLCEALKGPDGRLLLSPARRRTFLAAYPSNHLESQTETQNAPTDHEFDRVLRALSPQDSLNQLWNVYRSYKHSLESR